MTVKSEAIDVIVDRVTFNHREACIVLRDKEDTAEHEIYIPVDPEFAKKVADWIPNKDRIVRRIKIFMEIP